MLATTMETIGQSTSCCECEEVQSLHQTVCPACRMTALYPNSPMYIELYYFYFLN